MCQRRTCAEVKQTIVANFLLPHPTICLIVVLISVSFEYGDLGKLVLLCGGNKFTLHQKEGDKLRWRCIKKKTGCTAFITTTHEHELFKIRSNHNH